MHFEKNWKQIRMVSWFSFKTARVFHVVASWPMNYMKNCLDKWFDPIIRAYIFWIPTKIASLGLIFPTTPFSSKPEQYKSDLFIEVVIHTNHWNPETAYTKRSPATEHKIGSILQCNQPTCVNYMILAISNWRVDYILWNVPGTDEGL